MNSLESSKETLKKKEKDFDEEDEYNKLIGRYEVNNGENDSQKTSIFVRRQRKQIRLPFIFYIFIFTILLFFGFFGFLIYQYLDNSLNYIYDDKPFEKSILSNYNYTNLTFENGLEILLVQTGENELAGGTITFDYKNLDCPNKFWELKLAMNSIISNNISRSESLSEYLGKFKTFEEENSFSISFYILNEGFFEYLKILKNITFIEDKDERFSENNFEKVKNIIKNQIIKINKWENENYILKYFIFGSQKVLPKDNKIFLNDETNDSIKEISKSLLKPNKIKIVLASRFKPSLMKKKFLKYFKNIINSKKEMQNNTLYNSSNINKNESTFSKQKIIYLKKEEYEGNYIKINYYIDKNEKETFEEFYENQGYFNYLKYILDETNEDSLFNLLANNPNYTIKNLTTNFKIILKNKIEFSLTINLAPSSHKYLEDIIFLAYQYMNKFIKHINIMNSKDERLKELETIINQNFTFQEDGTDNALYFTKILSKNLYDKKNKKFFLNRRWIPSLNIEDVKYYFSQLIPEKSIIILAVNENSKSNFVGNNRKFNLTKFKNYNIEFFNISFSYCDFDTDFKKYFNENETTIHFHNNTYISKYMKVIDRDEKDKNNVEINIKKTNLSEFNFYRDTRFRLPKVYISFTLFHPYMRPYNESEHKDCIYFESILYQAFIKREIELKLSDAIRAGNSITVGFKQNQIYIGIFAFSDVAEKIAEEIRNIMKDNNSFKKIHDFDDINKFEFYMRYSFEEILKINDTSLDTKFNYYFYYALNEKIYKTYEFPLKELKDFKKCKETFNSINELITYFYIDCHIYGFYEESQAKKIANLFNEFERSEENFKNVLEKAGLTKENLNSSTFKQWMMNISLYDEKTIKKVLILNDKINITNRYIYIFWSDYTIINRVKSNIFRKILKNSELYKSNIKLDLIYYNNIYLVLQDTSKNNSNDNQSEINKLNETIYNAYIAKQDYYEKKLDSIGHRLYYLITSMIRIQYLRTKDMISTARTHLNSEFYTFENHADLKKEAPDLKELKYEYFIKYYIDILPKSYIDIHYNYSNKL